MYTSADSRANCCLQSTPSKAYENIAYRMRNILKILLWITMYGTDYTASTSSVFVQVFACMLSEAILLFISTSLAVYQQWQPQTDIDTGWWQHTPFSKVIRFYSNVTRPVLMAPSGTHPAQFFRLFVYCSSTCNDQDSRCLKSRNQR